MENYFLKIQQEENCSRKSLPSVHTIDSSQGREADWVVMFTTAEDASKPSSLGFMMDDNRINVAVTCAKHVFHYVCGTMQGRQGELKEYNLKPGEKKACLLVLYGVMLQREVKQVFIDGHKIKNIDL